ncbi:MAG: hypothetical protein BWY17_04883 [Deltaproteobacteria bacterium ADurb.Bin207]|nr:MAG: hypothetical protein BWY17_04883 [Deltaproteobacteria bacterium ADurb.Bin207]
MVGHALGKSEEPRDVVGHALGKSEEPRGVVGHALGKSEEPRGVVGHALGKSEEPRGVVGHGSPRCACGQAGVLFRCTRFLLLLDSQAATSRRRMSYLGDFVALFMASLLALGTR